MTIPFIDDFIRDRLNARNLTKDTKDYPEISSYTDI